MDVSLMLTSLPADFSAAARQAAALGFTHVDVIALEQRPQAELDVLAETGLAVACASLGRGLPEGCAPDAAAADQRRTALDVLKRQVADAALLGATHAYVAPGTDTSPEALVRFGEVCALLADYAAQRMIRLCVEHFPGRALPGVATTLAWLGQIRHPNLSLLLDVGHCLISGEDPAQAVRQAGERLGYTQFDDNDGSQDLHWPLLTGRLTEETLRATLAALAAGPYRGALALELNARNPEPGVAAGQGKALLERLWPGP
jgi:sugar phosphate isomerase/epimerase